MGRSVLVSIAVAVACAATVWTLGRLLDSRTLTTLAVAAGGLAGVGNFLTARTDGAGHDG